MCSMKRLDVDGDGGNVVGLTVQIYRNPLQLLTIQGLYKGGGTESITIMSLG